MDVSIANERPTYSNMSTYKIVIAGPREAGKTYAIHTELIGRTPDRTLPSIGCDVHFLRYQGENFGGECTFCTWDIGSGLLERDVFHNYISQADGLILMYPATDPASRLVCMEYEEKILNEVGEIPVVYVATKADLVADERIHGSDYLHSAANGDRLTRVFADLYEKM